MRMFYQHELINLKIGRSQDTALLRAVTVGNYEIAEMLLDQGAGHPPLCYPRLFPSFLFGSFFLVPPELYPGERTCLVSLGIAVGKVGV